MSENEIVEVDVTERTKVYSSAGRSRVTLVLTEEEIQCIVHWYDHGASERVARPTWLGTKLSIARKALDEARKEARKPKVREQVEAALAELDGQSIERIGEILRAEGIKGKPFAGAQCPIARYIKAKVPEAGDSIAVAGAFVSFAAVGEELARTIPSSAKIDTPESVQRFITAFDSLAPLVDR